jgi:hypothetical protein
LWWCVWGREVKALRGGRVAPLSMRGLATTLLLLLFGCSKPSAMINNGTGGRDSAGACEGLLVARSGAW